MKKDRLYFYTFLAISLIFLFISSLAVRYFIKASANQLIEVQVESSKREANEIAKLVAHQFVAGLQKETIIEHIQTTISKTNTDTWFISVLDWSGKEICHPDKTRIGQQTTSNQILIESLKEKNSSDNLYELLVSSNSISKKNTSEIIHTTAVTSSDLIVAANVNVGNIAHQMNSLKTNFYLIFLIMGALVIFFSFVAVRIIGSNYEKQLELKNSTLTSEVVSLSKLNSDLVSYKEKVAEVTTPDESNNTETKKSRILTYVRNELVPTAIENIDFAFTENTITYIVDKDNKRSTTNLSLDELYSHLPSTLFFRANRQYIIGINAIDKILKYGNSQLKIVVQANTDVEIIISKNKAAEFKQWLNS